MFVPYRVGRHITGTPITLTLTYAVFSVFFYIAIPSVVNSILWYIYISIQTFVIFSVMNEAISSLRPNVESRRARRRVAKFGFPDLDGEENEHRCPKIDLVLVAYLPNEQYIIKRQIRYALTQIEYPASRLAIYVVYNTPEAIEPLESELHEMTTQHSHLKVVSVPNSTSKADNINYYLNQVSEADITAIFDTDHYPSRYSLKWVAREFNKGDVDIIQGRCCVYNYSESWITRLIAAEFDMIYGVFHPGRTRSHRFGLFGGSNGYWNASLLRCLGMQKHMLTEDIDSTLRAIVSGARVRYMLEVQSYETAPQTVMALLKQRMRWTQGWFQVTLRHAIPSLRYGAYGNSHPLATSTKFISRAGLFFLLIFREAFFYLISQLSALLIASAITHPPQSWKQLYEGILGFKVTVWLFVLSCICISTITAITARNRSEFTEVWAIFAFGLLSPVYYTIVTFMSITCHFRELVQYSNWNPTTRSAPKKVS